MIRNKIRNVLRKLGYNISRVGDVDLLGSLIYKKHHENFFFLQIGANDGKRFDPLFDIVNELKLSGIAIEPVKSYYSSLVNNYRNNSKVTPLNVAIWEENKRIKIYRAVDNSDLPEWSKGIASLNPHHYKKSNTKKEDIITEEVDAITFDNLFYEYNIENIDLLQIDTEGYDYELLKMFPFDRYKPSIIQFEHGLPNKIMTVEELLEINLKLINLGYKTIMKEYDMICYL